MQTSENLNKTVKKKREKYAYLLVFCSWYGFFDNSVEE